MGEVDLKKLENADPLAYAVLCEKAGYKDEAIRIYANSKQPRGLLHATELAFGEGDYDTAQELIKRTRESIDSSLHDSPPYGKETSWGAHVPFSMGEAMGRCGRHEDAKKIDSALSKIEKQLAEIKEKI